MNSLESIFSYMGNKIKISDWVVQSFCSHRRYVEVFGGTWAVGMNKPPSPIEIYNDKNQHLTNLFEVIRTNKSELIRRFTSHSVSEAFYNHYHGNHEPVELGDIEAAVRYLYIMSLCAYGKYDGGIFLSFEKTTPYIFDKKARIIDKIHRRIKGAIIMTRNYDKVIRNCDSEETLFYLDPPYKDTESYYKTIVGDFTANDHIRLRDILSKIKGKFCVSYEANEFIHNLYKDFNIISKNKVRQGYNKEKRGTGKAKEIIITNYEIETNLFTNAFS